MSKLRRFIQAGLGLGWIIVLALIALFTLWTAFSERHRRQNVLAQILVAKGDTMIRAIEAGGRMGMHGPLREFRLRSLLDEMVQQEDALFLTVVQTGGTMEALSESTPGVALDVMALNALPMSEEPTWAVREDEQESFFLVFRTYRPLRRQHMRHRPRIPVPDSALASRFVVVGLDSGPYQQARRKDAMTAYGSCIFGLALAGTAGILFFWRRKAQTLERQVAKAERLAAMGTLAAGVAHEIRNPLSSIKGFATYFGQKFAPDSPDRELAQVMVGEVERVNRVVSELLELTRPSDLRLRPQNPWALLQHALRLVEGDCQASNITIQATAGSQEVVLLDADRMQQALLNVLLNAIQSMPEGGALAATVLRQRDRLEFRIKDTGIGLSPQDQARIFDPYFTTRGQGTGLGLPLVQKIVEAHGGRIRLTSVLGQGTEVVLELPVRKEEA